MRANYCTVVSDGLNTGSTDYHSTYYLCQVVCKYLLTYKLAVTNIPKGQVFPYTSQRNPVSDHFDGRWIKRVSMGVMRMDTGLQPKLRSIIQILRLSNKPSMDTLQSI